MRKLERDLLMMIGISCTFLVLTAIFLLGCSASKSFISASTKYPLEKIQKDYTIFRDVLEESHPGLYWYTPKDSMDYFFNNGYRELKDSMTEPEFRKVLSFVTASIKCGHTAIRPSKRYSRFIDSARTKIFPLSLKIWDDTAVFVSSLNRRDSILKRGVVVNKINGKPVAALIDTLSKYISADGYNKTHKWQTLSNRNFFGSLYISLFGLSEKYNVEYTDSNGQVRSVMIPAYNPVTDTAGRSTTAMPGRFMPAISKKERKQLQLRNTRSFRIDSANHTAIMNLNTFSRGSQIKKFLRSSFRSFQKNKVRSLVIDVRSNGGGSVTNSTILTRYIADHPFKVSDSLYAIKRRSRYGRYIQNNLFNHLFIRILTRKKKDGNYHFGYFERHYFKPKKKRHFNGRVYIITGGNSFSATTLFVDAVKGQDNVTVVGEETGGGAYGNSAWLIPEVTLPETGVRFRLPLFRLVIDNNIPKNGRGVFPEIEIKPTVHDIRGVRDNKILKVMELLRDDKKKKEN